MIRINHTLTALAAGLVLSSSALAAGPAAGEGPFFQFDSLPAGSQLQRAEVQALATHEAPLAGELPAAPLQLADTMLTRAQVRSEAVAHQPAAGIAPFGAALPASASVKARASAATPLALHTQPAAGNLPLAEAPMNASTLARAEVRSEALAAAPAVGEFTAQQAALPASALSRAEVRASTRDALARGFHVASGELS
ncbi:hypothetical protein [Comamonas sp. NLF-1-9]|uniref:hypothetical protein n=1 Tax=Comamonas sp. NLF-1-9 TaxID=2853163 RepID=UPI001C467746|nr:hypothetical protein [Comamonas sp. NLF-1-9]QXL83784.1 hypothetical protein KUD94_11095 [Comamonas sp. NLF-1-9]